MLYLHPVAQVAATLLCLLALGLAWPRIVSLHLGRKVRFDRRRHVLVGALGLGLMTLGLFGGLLVARLSWGGWLVTGEHGQLGLAMLPCLAFGLLSGWVLHRRPRPRRWLPALHGINNILVLALAIYQAWEGAEVIEQFVRGM